MIYIHCKIYIVTRFDWSQNEFIVSAEYIVLVDCPELELHRQCKGQSYLLFSYAWMNSSYFKFLAESLHQVINMAASLSPQSFSSASDLMPSNISCLDNVPLLSVSSRLKISLRTSPVERFPQISRNSS